MKKAIDKHAKYTTTELDRSRPVKKGAATRRRLFEKVVVNMSTSFVGKVIDVRHIAEAQIGGGVADMVEFESALARGLPNTPAIERRISLKNDDQT